MPPININPTAAEAALDAGIQAKGRLMNEIRQLAQVRGDIGKFVARFGLDAMFGAGRPDVEAALAAVDVLLTTLGVATPAAVPTGPGPTV